MTVGRWKARSAVLVAVSLSRSARLLYMLLDDLDWDSKGYCWPKQDTIAAKIGYSTRDVSRGLKELAEAGYLVRERHRAHCVYRMAWALRDTTPVANLAPDTTPVANQDTPRVANLARASINETSKLNIDRSSVCSRCGEYHDGVDLRRCGCGAVHDPAAADSVEPLQAAERLLSGYVERCGLDWPPPDAAICARVLNAAGGVRKLYDRLMWLLHEKRVKPTKSYAWFESCVARKQERSA